MEAWGLAAAFGGRMGGVSAFAVVINRSRLSHSPRPA